MSKEDIFLKKLSALLHDPIDKPFILIQGVNHEERTGDLANRLNVWMEESTGADWIASGMERVFLPKGSRKRKEFQVRFLDEPEIKHPLSRKDLECSELKKFRIEDVQNVVERTVENIVFDEPERQFLSLWRNYIEQIKKDCPKNRKYWSVIPADTRIPYHSIF